MKPCGIAGLVLVDVGDWASWGVEPGDVLVSSNKTGGISDGVDRHTALNLPEGAEIIVIRGLERLRIVLGKGIIDRAYKPFDNPAVK